MSRYTSDDSEDLILNICCAADLLKPDETAIVLFTRGLHLELVSGADGSGWSGYWSTKPNRHLPLHKVIIYNRPQEQVPLKADIYVADYVEAAEATEGQWRGKIVVRFRYAAKKGTTDRNWYEFADTGTFPVRYLSGT